MAASLAMVAKLRRMINDTDVQEYASDELTGYLELYPLVDSAGLFPDETGWVASYDFHAAAADLWSEKAATVAVDFDFDADGGKYTRSQVHAQYMKQAKYHSSRRAIGSIQVEVSPQPTVPDPWIGNLAEVA